MSIGAITPRDQLDRMIALVRRSLRYWWVTAVVLVVGTGLAVAFALSRPRLYESSTKIMYREMISSRLVAGTNDGDRGGRSMTARFREMAEARPLLQRVIEKTGVFDDQVETQGMTSTVEDLLEAMRVGGRPGSTFMISYRGPTPEQAQLVTATIANELIAWEEELQMARVSKTREFLDEQRTRSKDELEARDRELAEFYALHPEFAAEEVAGAGGGGGAGVRAANSADDARASGPVDPQLRALQRQRARIQARLAAAAGVPPPRNTNRELTPEQRRAEEDVRAAQRDVTNAKREVEDKLARYTDRHPDVRTAKSRLAASERLLAKAQERAATAAGLTRAEAKPPTADERTALQSELGEVNRQITSYKRRAQGVASTPDPKVHEGANRVVTLETDFQRLRRSVYEAQERYDSVDSKAFSAEMMAASELASQGGQLDVVEPAHLPTKPAGPGRTILVLMGMVAFGAIGVTLALGLALVDDRIVSKYDVERLEILPVLTVIPKHSKPKRLPSA